MSTRFARLLAILVIGGLSLAALVPAGHVQAGGAVGGGGPAAMGAPFTVVARGLDHPKGLAFSPSGALFVAESGHSDGTCPPPTITQTVTSAGTSGAVAQVAADGTVTHLLTGLASICDVGDFIGPSGLAFVGQYLYVAQGSCLGQLPLPALPCVVSQPLLRVRPDGLFKTVAQFISHGNGGVPNEPDEDPFGLTRGPDGNLYVSDGANNAVWKLGATTRLLESVDKPLVQFPHDPTVAGLAFSKGGFLYVALFGKAPFLPGSGKVARVMGDGSYQFLLTGLNSPIGVAFSPAGTMYILQYSSAFVLKPFPHFLPNTGMVWRLTPSGALQPAVTGLNFPTAMTFGPNGNLYITNNGTGTMPAAIGQVVTAAVGP